MADMMKLLRLFLLSFVCSLCISCSSVPGTLNLQPNSKGVKTITFPYAEYNPNSFKIIDNGDIITATPNYDYRELSSSSFYKVNNFATFTITRFNPGLDTIWQTSLKGDFIRILGISCSDEFIYVVTYNSSNPWKNFYSYLDSFKVEIKLKKLDVQSGKQISEETIINEPEWISSNKLEYQRSNSGFILYYVNTNQQTDSSGIATMIRFNTSKETFDKFVVPFTRSSLTPIFNERGEIYIPEILKKTEGENVDVICRIKKYGQDFYSPYDLSVEIPLQRNSGIYETIGSYNCTLLDDDIINFTVQNLNNRKTIRYKSFVFDFKDNKVLPHIIFASDSLNLEDYNVTQLHKVFGETFIVAQKREIETSYGGDVSSIGGRMVSTIGTPTRYEVFNSPFIMAFNQAGQIQWNILLPKITATPETRLQSFVIDSNIYILLRNKTKKQGFQLTKVDLRSGESRQLILPFKIDDEADNEFWYIREKLVVSPEGLLYIFINEGNPSTIQKLFQIDVKNLGHSAKN